MSTYVVQIDSVHGAEFLKLSTIVRVGTMKLTCADSSNMNDNTKFTLKKIYFFLPH